MVRRVYLMAIARPPRRHSTVLSVHYILPAAGAERQNYSTYSLLRIFGSREFYRPPTAVLTLYRARRRDLRFLASSYVVSRPLHLFR